MKRSIQCLVLVAAATACALAWATPGNNGGGNGGCGVGQQTNGCGTPIPGPVGPQGPQGIPGRDGTDGVNGTNGADGKDGRDGVDGTNGQDGAAGRDGQDGTAGAKGDQGEQGLQGQNAPDAVTAPQLNAAVGATNAQVASLREQINTVSKAAYAGTAAALALQMPALNPHKPNALTMRLGVGSYKGQSAVGISFRRGNKTGDWSVSGGVSGTSQGTGVALGLEHSF